MDPNAAIVRLRELAIELADVDDDAPGVAYPAAELAELFQNLDAWILRGGALPASWAGAILVKGSLIP